MKNNHIKALFLVVCFSFNAVAQSVPPITSGETYPSYRQKLVKEGWVPVKPFIFKNKDSVVLKIHTVGESLGVQKTVGGGLSTPSPKTSEASASVQRKTNQSADSSSPSGLSIDLSSRGSALGLYLQKVFFASSTI